MKKQYDNDELRINPLNQKMHERWGGSNASSAKQLMINLGVAKNAACKTRSPVAAESCNKLLTIQNSGSTRNTALELTSKTTNKLLQGTRMLLQSP